MNISFSIKIKTIVNNYTEPLNDETLYNETTNNKVLSGMQAGLKKADLMERVAYLIWEVAYHFPNFISHLRRSSRIQPIEQSLPSVYNKFTDLECFSAVELDLESSNFTCFFYMCLQ